MAKKFEYTIGTIKHEYSDIYEGDAQIQLNAFGKEGWELIDAIVMPAPKTAGAYVQVWYFKREIMGQPT